jgi:predicted metal-binding membrane protein
VPALDTLLRRDRAIVGGALVATALVAWLYLFHLSRAMPGMNMADMPGMAMSRDHAWGVVDVALLFVMWAAMMIAMMVPAAAPMVLTFAMVQRKRREQDRASIPTAVFLLGYAVVWTGYAAAVALAQWQLHEADLLSTEMVSASAWLGGVLLLVAGVFQWTSLKQACLAKCRSPLSFLMTEWREGPAGAFVMGARHGAYCVACCWALTALLFVVGVMNLLWVSGLAVFVLAERVLPGGPAVSRAAGALLVVTGVFILIWG